MEQQAAPAKAKREYKATPERGFCSCAAGAAIVTVEVVGNRGERRAYMEDGEGRKGKRLFYI